MAKKSFSVFLILCDMVKVLLLQGGKVFWALESSSIFLSCVAINWADKLAFLKGETGVSLSGYCTVGNWGGLVYRKY